MKPSRLTFIVCLLVVASTANAETSNGSNSSEEFDQLPSVTGRYGGRLVVGERAEPKTLNPVIATDAISREVIGRINADLIEINRNSQQTEPALAKAWKVSPNGRTFTLELRKGIRFSDGHPFDADDVAFSFQVYLDEAVASPQRDLLIIDGKPPIITKLSQYTVQFVLPKPYAAAERLFDGFAILPKHLLEQPYRQGHFNQVWSLNTPPAEIAGLGPFRVKQYLAGQRIILERNPYYWKTDRDNHRLPYLNELAFLFVGSEDAQLMRFETGETDIISRLSSENYSLLDRDAPRLGLQLADLGPSLEYNFLLFNLNDLSSKKLDTIARKQAWFRNLKFRQAISAAIDRDSIVQLVYGNRGVALWGNVGPGNRLWMDPAIPHPARSLEMARQLLKSAGFSWSKSDQLLDPLGTPVEFTIVASSSNAQRIKMATLVQDDLAHLGMQVNVVPLEFRAMLSRVFDSFDYEAAILGLGGGDADPNPEMNVWLSSGSSHLWNLGESSPATPWEAEIDKLMEQQMVTLTYSKRKQLYDRVQELVAENLPFIFLATSDVLVAGKNDIGNFHPALLDPYVLWNVEQLYLRGTERAGIR